MSSQSKPNFTPDPTQWQRHHAIQAEASCITPASSSCHQTCVFHLSTHFFAISLKLLRSSNEQGSARTQQIIMEKRLNSGQIHATSHSSMMLNYRNPSTVQDGRKATTQISSLHLEASQTCVRSQSWSLSRTSNTTQSVLATTQSWYHKPYLSDDVLTS